MTARRIVAYLAGLAALGLLAAALSADTANARVGCLAGAALALVAARAALQDARRSARYHRRRELRHQRD